MQQSSTLDCSKEFPPIPCLWKIACFPQALSQSCSVCCICLHPEHVFQNIRLIQLSSAVYLQIHLPCCETFQPRPRASLLLRVHQQQNQLQRNNPGDGGLHDRWHTYLQRRSRCCSLGKDRLMLAASQPLEHFTAKSVFIQVPRMPWTRL